MAGGITILLGRGERVVELHLALANRHGLVAGATGTGKTITLQGMAESFSRAGVPVFCADVKGDLSGLAMPGKPNPKLEKRAAELGCGNFTYEAAPVIFWDLIGRQGHPIRATVSEMGPLLLARLLELRLRGRDQAEAMGRKGREKVLREYDWGVIAGRLEQTYASVLREAGARSAAV